MAVQGHGGPSMGVALAGGAGGPYPDPDRGLFHRGRASRFLALDTAAVRALEDHLVAAPLAGWRAARATQLDLSPASSAG